jgi:hypothetical protein
MRKLWPAAAVVLVAGSPSPAGVIFNTTAGSLAGGSRWDAAPRTVGGVERSLDGGLRYSLQGGSYESYRDRFTWNGGTPPPVASFQQAVEKAFAAWTVPDPVSGLTTALRFAPDLGTPVNTAVVSGVRQGAEIDLFAATSGSTWGVGDPGTRAEAFFNSVSVPGNLTLTSGTTNYSGLAITGADITFNSNPQAVYTLSTFQTILTHEIGHALGLGDVDFPPGNSVWIDDDFDGSSSATALATLTNSWTHLVNPIDPANSDGLRVVSPPPANGSPGVDTPGVDILMESSIPGSLFGLDFPLQNDDFGTRQFLYPSTTPVPEPSVALAAAAGAVWLLRRRRRAVGSA